jgi:Xaa-Pro aminopeptidase
LAIIQRLDKLQNKLIEQGLDAIIITQPENRRYLSGFGGSAGLLFISPQDAILATDFRYIDQAQAQATSFSIIQTKGQLSDWFPEFISQFKIRRLGFENMGLYFAEYEELSRAIEGIPIENRPQLTPCQSLVESLRAIKEQGELNVISKAAVLADTALEHIASIMQPGMREREIAWEIERFLRENGSEPVPFDLIVASGPNSALPHAQPTDRPIQYSEPVVIDIGARVEGYCSNTTRTFCLGKPNQTLTQIHQITLEAQSAAIEAIESGMSGGEADRSARAVIEQHGYGENFGHGLGHGIGLAAHEEPHISSGSKSILAEGMVFTIEPGIYVKGWGGVRIEDMVVLQKGKAQVLTKSEKRLRRNDAQ